MESHYVALFALKIPITPVLGRKAQVLITK